MQQVKDALVEVPIENWCNLQEAFKSDWPSGISGYTVLETQRKWMAEGFDYGFKVFCPFGDGKSGTVALNQKDAFYEVIIQSPSKDTTKLEKALKETKVIDWHRNIIVPYAPNHVIECIKRVVETVNMNIELILPSESFILEKQAQRFDNVNLSPLVHFGILTAEHIPLVNSTWPHKYPGSSWYFELLIKTKSGYGLFYNNDLISWIFINEAGTLGHMYTIEEHRRKGYAELLLKLICNKLLDEKKDVFAFAVKGNRNACNLYKKVGFTNFDGVSWCYLKGKTI